MQTLRLEGLQDPNEASQMSVCPIVPEDNCCSKVDELKIFKSWTSYSQPKLKKFARDFQDIHKNIMSLDYSFKKLNPDFIKYHYTKYEWVKKKVKQCISGKYLMQESNIDQIDPFDIKKIFRESFSKLYTKKLLEKNPTVVLNI